MWRFPAFSEGGVAAVSLFCLHEKKCCGISGDDRLIEARAKARAFCMGYALIVFWVETTIFRNGGGIGLASYSVHQPGQTGRMPGKAAWGR